MAKGERDGGKGVCLTSGSKAGWSLSPLVGRWPDVPVPMVQSMQAQLVHDQGHVHGDGVFLLVSLSSSPASMSMSSSWPRSPFWVTAVNHKDETLCVLAVVVPQRPDLVLDAHVPHGEAAVLILHDLHIETCVGAGGHDFTQLQCVQDGGPPCSGHAHRQNMQMTLEELGKVFPML